MGVTLVFSRLVLRPVTSPKEGNRSARLLRSLRSGFTKIAASSAYIEILKRATRPCSLCKSLRSVAFESSRCRGSNARMNSRGERGSPCRSPRSCRMGSVGKPLTRILEVEVERVAAIQFIQRWGSPYVASRRVDSPSVPSRRPLRCRASQVGRVSHFGGSALRCF